MIWPSGLGDGVMPRNPISRHLAVQHSLAVVQAQSNGFEESGAMFTKADYDNRGLSFPAAL